MSPDFIKKLMHAERFRAFDLHLAGGRAVRAGRTHLIVATSNRSNAQSS